MSKSHPHGFGVPEQIEIQPPYSCSSTASNSFHVVPAASAGYGNSRSELHRFRCHFFYMTLAQSNNFILLIPSVIHCLPHMKDPLLASLSTLGSLV